MVVLELLLPPMAQPEINTAATASANMPRMFLSFDTELSSATTPETRSFSQLVENAAIDLGPCPCVQTETWKSRNVCLRKKTVNVAQLIAHDLQNPGPLNLCVLRGPVAVR